MAGNITTLPTVGSEVGNETSVATMPPFQGLHAKEWAHNVEIVFLLVVISIGIPGNLLLVIIQAKNKKKTSTDYLLMIMAIYELVCCSYNAPMKLLRKVPYIDNNLLGTTFRCRFNLFFLNFTGLGAAQMLAAIAIDRYIKVCWPLNTFYGEKQAFITSGVIVFTSFALSLPHVVFIDWSDAIQGCLIIRGRFISPSTYGRYLTIVFFVVFCILAFSYVNIHISMKLRYRKKRRASRHTSGGVDSTGVTVKMSDETAVTCTKTKNEGISNANDSVSPGPQIDATCITGTDEEDEGLSNANGSVSPGPQIDVTCITETDASKKDTTEEQGQGGHTNVGLNARNNSAIDTTRTHGIEVNSVVFEEKSSPAAMGYTDNTADKGSLAYVTESGAKGLSIDGNIPSSMLKYSSRDQQRLPANAMARQNSESRTMNRLTVTMALISLIYVITGFFNWIMFLLGTMGLFLNAIDFSWLHLSFSLPLINCITNPVLLFTMSEKFKHAAKKIICGK